MTTQTVPQQNKTTPSPHRIVIFIALFFFALFQPACENLFGGTEVGNPSNVDSNNNNEDLNEFSLLTSPSANTDLDSDDLNALPIENQSEDVIDVSTSSTTVLLAQIIQNTDDCENLWAALFGTNTIPEIDFSANVMVAIVLDSDSTRDELEITSVGLNSDDQFEIEATQHINALACPLDSFEAEGLPTAVFLVDEDATGYDAILTITEEIANDCAY